MSFLTCFCDLPQKLHLTRSPPSPNLATPLVSPALCHAGGLRYPRKLPGGDDFVDNAVLAGLFRAHDEVAVGVLLDLLYRLPGVMGKHLVEQIPHPQDLLGLQLYVGGLSGRPPVGLVDEDAGVREGEALAPGPPGQQHGSGRGGLAVAEGRFVGLDELHGVVDGEKGGDVATGGVDVEVDLLVRILVLEEQELGAHQVGDGVVDGGPDEDDPLPQQPGVQVVRPFAPIALLYDRWDQVVVHGLDGHGTASGSLGSGFGSGAPPAALTRASEPASAAGAASEASEVAEAAGSPASASAPSPGISSWSRARSTGRPSSSTTSTCSSSQAKALDLRMSVASSSIWSFRTSWRRRSAGLAP